MYKAWIVIVICSSSLAFYLDVVENCSSASCVNMLKLFLNQYGAPKEVISDNGSAFTSKEVKEFITLHGIKWSYNIAEVPWTGEFFERMVRSVKRCFKKGQARVYIYDDGIIEPLSPNNLIHGRAIATRCEDIVNMKETDVSAKSLNQRYKYVHSLIKHFWRR